VKFARAIVSEIIGIDGVPGKKTSSRIDPLGIRLGPVLYETPDHAWTLDEEKARRKGKTPVKLGKDGKPSEANHGNVTPTITDGGFTIRHAVQTTVLSLPSLRRLRFPAGGKRSPALDQAGQAALAVLGVLAVTLAVETDYDLRSRCFLVPEAPLRWELIGKPGTPARQFTVSAEEARQALNVAVNRAIEAGLPYHAEEVVLRPSDELVELVRRSYEMASAGQEGDA
jgi:CRISPR-associated protein Csb1